MVKQIQFFSYVTVYPSVCLFFYREDNLLKTKLNIIKVNCILYSHICSMFHRELTGKSGCFGDLWFLVQEFFFFLQQKLKKRARIYMRS